jgi:aspartate/methionine/tyrosine aminotransferase
MVSMYKKRRDVFYKELNAIGWKCTPPEATFHCWLPTPKGVTSMDCATKLLEEAAIVTVPGSGFGPAGEGYIRAVLTVNEERLALAAQRIKNIKF